MKALDKFLKDYFFVQNICCFSNEIIAKTNSKNVELKALNDPRIGLHVERKIENDFHGAESAEFHLSELNAVSQKLILLSQTFLFYIH